MFAPPLAAGARLHHGGAQRLCYPPRRYSAVVCFSVPPSVNRRSASLAMVFLLSGSILPSQRAVAGSPFDKYVKRKKLEPLETYVPPVLLTQEQLKDLEKSLDVEQPKFDVSRSSLRSGPVSSLRVNIRAVAQYAADEGKGKTASDAVDKCLRALEELDSLLLHASRNDPAASVKSMKDNINTAVLALDSLLQTVPPAVLDKGKTIVDAYMTNAKTEQIEDLDPELKQLESIL